MLKVVYFLFYFGDFAEKVRIDEILEAFFKFKKYVKNVKQFRSVELNINMFHNIIMIIDLLFFVPNCSCQFKSDVTN